MEPKKDIFEQWAEERESRSWIVRKLNHIRLWWDHDGKYLGKTFKTGVKNIVYWLPIIWKDRNWDHRYIYTILEHKLKAQSKYIGGRDWHEGAKRDAEIMMTCARLINKVSDEFYSSEYTDYHKSKHWFTPSTKEGYSDWNSRTLHEDFDKYFAKYPLSYKKVMNGSGPFNLDGKDANDVKKSIAMNIAYVNQERAHKLLFKILQENIEKWWD